VCTLSELDYACSNSPTNPRFCKSTFCDSPANSPQSTEVIEISPLFEHSVGVVTSAGVKASFGSSPRQPLLTRGRWAASHAPAASGRISFFSGGIADAPQLVEVEPLFARLHLAGTAAYGVGKPAQNEK